MFLRFYLLGGDFLRIFFGRYIYYPLEEIILITDCCMFVRTMLLGVTLFHFFCKNCIFFGISRIVSVLLVSALRCFSINIGYCVY